MATAQASLEIKSRPVAVAPVWHTVALLIVIAGTSFLSARRISHMDPAIPRSHILPYLQVIASQWVLVGFIMLGMRRSGARASFSLRQLVGGRWESFDDVLLDVLIAAGYWIVGVTVIALGKLAMGLLHTSNLADIKRTFGFIAPHGGAEIVLWIVMCVSVGFCEEVIFRGYLQRQFIAWTASGPAGIIVCGIVFGAAHLYQGWSQMVLLALYGTMFGILAYVRKSLRPGIIAHAWQDILTGLILSILTR